jgi:UDP-glucose 4-epimerase
MVASPLPKRWLITGGCGFIGSSLIRKLVSLNQGMQIRVLDNLLVGTRDDLAELCVFAELDPGSNGFSWSDRPRVQLVVGDILDADLVHWAASGAECIVHLAANTGVGPSVDNPRLDMKTNVIGTFNTLEAARQHKVGKYLFASSGAPVGEVQPPIHEEMAPHPVSPYGASKLAGEGYCSAYFRTFGVNTVGLRFGNVYGPRSKHKSSVVAKFIRQALHGEICEIFGDGSQTRDFLFLDDLLDAVLQSVRCDAAGEIFQIATNQEHTVNEVAKELQQILIQKGIAMNIRHTATRLGDVRRNYSDTTKAERMLGWKSRTGLREGLLATVEYFCSM